MMLLAQEAESKRLRSLQLAIIAALALAGCVSQSETLIDFTFASGGSLNFPKVHPILEWYRTEGFTSASAHGPTSSDRLSLLRRGDSTVVIASEGYVLPLTANLRQYWTVIFCLPSQVREGAEYPLSWAGAGGIRNGQIAASYAWGLLGSDSLSRSAGRPAGTVRIVSQTEGSIRLRLTVTMNLPTHSEGVTERGRLDREISVALRPLQQPTVVYRAPKGSDDEAGAPIAGPITESLKCAVTKNRGEQ